MNDLLENIQADDRYSDEDLTKLAPHIPPGLELLDEDAVDNRFISEILFGSFVRYARQKGEVEMNENNTVYTARLAKGDLILTDDLWTLYGQGRLSLRYWPDELPAQYRFTRGEVVDGRVNNLVNGFCVLRTFVDDDGHPMVTASADTGHKSTVAPGYFTKR